MQAVTFLVGRLGNDLRWAGIDEAARHLQGRVCERRFGAYCAPFRNDSEARQALLEAGCAPDSISAEIRPRRARRG